MKRIALSLFAIAAISFAATAQVKTNPSSADKSMQEKNWNTEGGKHHRGMHDHMMMKDLNLSPAQKQQMKSLNEEFKNQRQALKNSDKSSPETRAKWEALAADHRAKVQSILTPEQQATMQKLRAEHKGGMQQMDGKRMQEMQSMLNLSNDQVAKLKADKETLHQRMKSIHDDASLSESQKKAQMMELRKETRQNFKGILTPEQLEKLKHSRHSEK